MKSSEINMLETADLESDLENLKKTILEAKGPSNQITIEAIEKIKQDVDQEMTNAFISMGLQEKLEMVNKLERSRALKTPQNQSLISIKEKEKIMQEFKQNLSRPGAYLGLKQKLEKLNIVSRLIEVKEKNEKVKEEINRKITPEIKAKIEFIKSSYEKLSNEDPLDEDLVKEVKKVKEELGDVIKSANLEIVGVLERNGTSPAPELKETMVNVDREIEEEIERAVSVAGIGTQIEEIKGSIAKGVSQEEIEKVEKEIKEKILACLDVTALEEKINKLRMEMTSSNKQFQKVQLVLKMGCLEHHRIHEVVCNVLKNDFGLSFEFDIPNELFLFTVCKTAVLIEFESRLHALFFFKLITSRHIRYM